jgi:signal transduction histidine kinase
LTRQGFRQILGRIEPLARRHIARATGGCETRGEIDPVGMSPRRIGCFLLIFLAAWTAAAWAQDAAITARRQKSVLILLPGQPGLPAASALVAGIHSTLVSALSTRIAIEVEPVDLAPFTSGDGPRLLRDLYRRKYAGRRFDAIVVAADEPFRFLLRWRDQLWPGVPVIVCAVDERTLNSFVPPSGMTILTIRYDLERTLRDALALLPETRHVALVGGAVAQDRFFADLGRQAVRTVDERLDLISLTGLSITDTLAQMSALPERTIVLATSFLADTAGQRFYGTEVIGPLAAATNRPLFTVFGTALGLGIVGGSLVDYQAVGREAGEHALRLLLGEPMPASPTRSLVASVPTFDWRQLRRWDLDENRLPPGSRVLFREQTVWERYRWHMVGAIGLLVAQALLIAGLLVERARRRRVQTSLAERLRFETLLAEISGPLASLPALRADDHIRSALGQIATFLGVDRASVWQLSADGLAISPTHTWSALGAPPPPGRIRLDNLPFLKTLTEETTILSFTSLDQLPAEAVAERQALAAIGVRSFAMIPLVSAEHRLGFLMLVNLREARAWPEDLMRRLQILGEPLASTLARQRWDTALTSSTALTQALLTGLPGATAVIDARGVIVQVNDTWAAFAQDGSAAIPAAVAPGANYLEACRDMAAVPPASAEKSAALIHSVLQEHQDEGMLEYIRSRAGGDRWFEMRVHRLKSPAGGAAVTHVDITARKLAERVARRHLGEIAHMDRVAAMGELAAALAHELNQPLTAILSNAQAAQRLLAVTPPDLKELHECLDDIVKDDRRAGEVIGRIRQLLKKETFDLQPFSLTCLAENVVALVANAALLHNVSIEFRPAPAVPVTHGDPVQIQQVILNLLTNAIAAAEGPPAEGRVTVWTSSGAAYVELGVRDSGKGIAEHDLARLFEPFFTTKRDGLGMGLVISRSIIEAHGGRIWGENDPAGGAVFRVHLPSKPRATV